MKIIQLPSGDLLAKKRGKVFILAENLSFMEVPFVSMEQTLKLSRLQSTEQADESQ